MWAVDEGQELWESMHKKGFKLESCLMTSLCCIHGRSFRYRIY